MLNHLAPKKGNLVAHGSHLPSVERVKKPYDKSTLIYQIETKNQDPFKNHRQSIFWVKLINLVSTQENRPGLSNLKSGLHTCQLGHKAGCMKQN